MVCEVFLFPASYFFCLLAVWKHVADGFRKFITNAKRQVVLHHEHCKFCFLINTFIALFWSRYHKAGYPLIVLFGYNALFMIIGGDVFRYVILPSSSYANVYSAKITFSVLIPFMTFTYETLIFLSSLLVLTAILLFLNFYPPLATLADQLPCAH